MGGLSYSTIVPVVIAGLGFGKSVALPKLGVSYPFQSELGQPALKEKRQKQVMAVY